MGDHVGAGVYQADAPLRIAIIRPVRESGGGGWDRRKDAYQDQCVRGLMGSLASHQGWSGWPNQVPESRSLSVPCPTTSATLAESGSANPSREPARPRRSVARSRVVLKAGSPSPARLRAPARGVFIPASIPITSTPHSPRAPQNGPGDNRFAPTLAGDRLYRGVAQRQRTCFGSRRPGVQIPPPRRQDQSARGCSSMVESQPSKLVMPVRSRSPALDKTAAHRLFGTIFTVWIIGSTGGPCQ